MPLDNISVRLDGLGHLLADKSISVPLYQRSYAWEEKHVKSFLQDIGSAISSGQKEYFLGSVVAADSPRGAEVVDGQQRLATTAILLASIRDYFFQQGDTDRSGQLETTYLITSDFRSQEVVPKLRLNAIDSDFFAKRVLINPGDVGRRVEPTRNSHRGLQNASALAAQHVQHLVETTNKPTDLLADWVDYLSDKAKVIWVQVPDHANAFTIFETLNDRGLDLAISDLLKNFLFNLAGNRINEVQEAWVEMVGALVAVDGEDQVVNFIRHVWSSYHGLTREKELFASIKNKTTSKQAAVTFGAVLSQGARRYAAILNPEHELWHQYGPTTRAHMSTLNTLRMTQMRPTILAILSKFDKGNVKDAMRMLVSWSVRFLTSGELGSSILENLYSDKAKQITNGKIKTAKQLADAAKDALPNDIQFLSAFSLVRVSKSYLARYYLQALERQARDQEHPELIPNANSEEVNLEHVLPQNPTEAEWPVTPEEAEAYCNRLGNLVLLTAEENSRLGNGSFEAKKKIFRSSPLHLTSRVAESTKWGRKEIEQRQTELARLAG
jgi:hypothetical protein